MTHFAYSSAEHFSFLVGQLRSRETATYPRLVPCAVLQCDAIGDALREASLVECWPQMLTGASKQVSGDHEQSKLERSRAQRLRGVVSPFFRDSLSMPLPFKGHHDRVLRIPYAGSRLSFLTHAATRAGS